MVLLSVSRELVRSNSHRFCLLWSLVLSATAASLAGTQACAEAAALPKTDPHLYAVLIGAAKYEKWPQLRYTVNDCEQLRQTLTERGGFGNWQLTMLTDDNEYSRPTRAAVMEQLQSVLNRVGPDDEVLVFFSGHGCQDDQGRLYLATLDCDPESPAETGVPILWLREQLATCKAKFKLLILDACHAGSEKGEGDKGVAAQQLGKPFDSPELNSVVTLASSRDNESSQEWDEKQQSLFTYWLNQGLKGHADENGDGAIDIDELNKYVHRNVTHTAEKRFHRQQTPVRIVRSGQPGVPVVLQLRPLTLKQVVADMAEQISWALEERGLKKVAVLEFTTDTKLGEALGANFGLLGKLCATDLQRKLMDQAGSQFSVLDQRRLQGALRKNLFKIEDLGSDEAMQRLAEALDGLPVIALGTLRSRLGRQVTLQCNLIETGNGEMAASVGGVAMLNESEWAMLGRSAVIAEGDEPPPPPSFDDPTGDDTGPQTNQVVYDLDKKSKGPHPLSDPNFPFPVRLRVNGQVRQGKFVGNNYYVPVRAGEEYEVVVEHRGGEPVMMRLLIDGLNTLPERETSTKGVRTEIIAKRVNLSEARAWVLDPKESRKFVVKGFVSQTGKQGKIRKFTVVDGQQSLAARQEFTDQLGLITVAFYKPASESRLAGSPSTLGSALGTGAGEEVDADLSERKMRVGELIGVVHLRYADEATIAATEQSPTDDEEITPTPSET
ncbi:MAG: caspase family protein [Pirellulales bacterium]|nr:caspase family protein [Pirellulales bacterium]